MAQGSTAQEAGTRAAQGGSPGSYATVVSGFKVTQLDHVDVTTPEELEEDVLDWYSTILGLERVDKPDGTHSRGGWFKVGDGEIHVTQDEHNPPKTAHFCLVVDDFVEAVERLRRSGCHIEQANPIPGRRRFYTRDPAGNRLEIMAYNP